MPITYAPTTGVIVTGAASGIGRSCAIALAEVDRPIAAWDLDEAAARSTADEIADRFGIATIAHGIDVRDTSRFDDAIAESRRALGTIGGLVHSAGVSNPTPIDDLDEEGWDLVLDVNLRAHAMLVRALLEDLRTNEGSAVVGISSINAILGNAANPAYGASKSGLLGLTRSLADRLAGDGVRVNAVCPGTSTRRCWRRRLSTLRISERRWSGRRCCNGLPSPRRSRPSCASSCRPRRDTSRPSTSSSTAERRVLSGSQCHPAPIPWTAA